MVRGAATRARVTATRPRGYPAELERTATLSNGTQITIRPILPADTAELRDAFRRADPDTLRERFLGATPKVTPALLTWLTHVDYRSRLALVARAPSGQGVGVARYEPTDKPGTAEVAVVVDPPWRRRGVATALLLVLAEAAAARGIDQFVATYTATNAPVAALLADAGARQVIAEGIAEAAVALGEG